MRSASAPLLTAKALKHSVHVPLAGVSDSLDSLPATTAIDSAGPSDNEDCSDACCTTMEVQNIPAIYRGKLLQKLIDARGFWGKYDYFYMMKGCALVNFASPAVAEVFRATFHGRWLPFMGSATLFVCSSPVQGIDDCVAFRPEGVVYAASGMIFVDSRPVVTRPPPGLGSKEGQRAPPEHEQPAGCPWP